MTVSLHVEANNLTELVQKVSAELGFVITRVPAAPTSAQAEAAAAAVREDGTAVALVADPAVPAASNRGRPRGSKKNTETAPAGAPEIPAVQPAVTDNTGSAPADTSPTAEGVANGAAAEASAPVATTDVLASAATTVVAAPSADTFRAKLQDLNACGEHGYKQVCALLEEFGFKRVKDVPPEKYADIVAKCDTWLAAQQKAA